MADPVDLSNKKGIVDPKDLKESNPKPPSLKNKEPPPPKQDKPKQDNNDNYTIDISRETVKNK